MDLIHHCRTVMCSDRSRFYVNRRVTKAEGPALQELLLFALGYRHPRKCPMALCCITSSLHLMAHDLFFLCLLYFDENTLMGASWVQGPNFSSLTAWLSVGN